MDVDSAMQLCKLAADSRCTCEACTDSPLKLSSNLSKPDRARSGSVAGGSPHENQEATESYTGQPALQHHQSADDFPMMSLAEQEEMLIAQGEYPHHANGESGILISEAEDLPPPHHHNLALDHDAVRLGVDMGLVNDINMGISSEPLSGNRETSDMGLGIGGLPVYQPTVYKSNFDFGCMEHFASEEKERLGITSPTTPSMGPLGSSSTGAELRRRLAQAANANAPLPPQAHFSSTAAPEYPESLTTGPDFGIAVSPPGPSAFSKKRQRKLSQSNSTPRRQGKLAQFEGGAAPSQPSLMPSTSHRITFGSDIYHSQPTIPAASTSGTNIPNGASSAPLAGPSSTGHDRPYRFSFYSNALPHTIHARSLSELPAEGQTFEDLFVGRGGETEQTRPSSQLSRTTPATGMATPATTDDANPKAPPREGVFGKGQQARTPGGSRRVMTDSDMDINTWWLDVTCPTDEEMRMLSKVRNRRPRSSDIL